MDLLRILSSEIPTRTPIRSQLCQPVGAFQPAVPGQCSDNRNALHERDKPIERRQGPTEHSLCGVGGEDGPGSPAADLLSGFFVSGDELFPIERGARWDAYPPIAHDETLRDGNREFLSVRVRHCKFSFR